MAMGRDVGMNCWLDEIEFCIKFHVRSLHLLSTIIILLYPSGYIKSVLIL
jgi:hypothetical protein